jgi:hypothetical protein
MKAIGKTMWAIPGGRIPAATTGHEPEWTSRDELHLLNAGDQEAKVEMTIFYSDQEPIGPYRLTVSPRRKRRVRFNDLIDPQAMPLDTDYGAVIESDVPIVVQFSRLDTGRAENAILGTMAFPVEE